MVKVGSSDLARRNNRAPKSPVAWLVTGFCSLLLAIFLFSALGSLAGEGSFLGYLATRATTFDAWGVLSIISVLLSLTAIVGAGYAIWRRRLVLALAISVLALPTHAVIEGSRCDTAALCRAFGWAALPAGAFDWSVRIRPVTDPNEAKGIASATVSKSEPAVSPFRAKRFGDYWIVSTIDKGGWSGPHAVRIDTKSAGARLVSCPVAKIQCGLERPVISDGRSVLHNDRSGISAIFPASLPVCTSRDKDWEAIGLYAMARAPDIPCEDTDDSRQIGIELSRWSMNGCTVTEAPSLPWRPLSPETARLFRSRPTLGATPSLACELHSGGHIEISVFAPVKPGSNPGGPRASLYQAYIVTTPDHLAEDVGHSRFSCEA
jgi:hypothetical protein